MFNDDDFYDVRKIMLVAQGKRQYAEGGTDFDDIPPHHIVIQGKFIRLLHDEMKAWPKLHSKLVVVGSFHLVSPDGQASVGGEESDEEAMVHEIVADVMCGQSRCLMTGSGEVVNEPLADEQATAPFTNSFFEQGGLFC